LFEGFEKKPQPPHPHPFHSFQFSYYSIINRKVQE
jgi:hypothetical protein